MIVPKDEASVKEQLMVKNKLVVGWFTATWCGPCKAVTPEVEKISQDLKDKLNIVKIDIDKFGDVTEEFEVASVPTFAFIKDGKVKAKITGANIQAIKTSITANIQ